jgi:hypothetical protein
MKGSFVLLLLSAASAHAKSPGAVTATGSMTAPRTNQTTTLLPDGKVLIAGGGSAAMEIYDPLTGILAATGAMAASKVVGSATLLPGGRFLIEGGNAECTIPPQIASHVPSRCV